MPTSICKYLQYLQNMQNVNCFCCQWKRHWEGKQKKQTLPIKLPSGTAGLCFTKERKFGIFIFFFGSYFAGGICNMADFLKLMTSDHQQKFFFKVKWVNIYDHLYSSRNASENSLRVVFQNSRCLSGHLCFHVFFNTAHIFKVEI